MQDLVSVIICTHNRSPSLQGTLENLAHQNSDGSFDYEVIVVDNNSNDGTRQVAEDFKKRFPSRFLYLFQPKLGKSKCLNKAIQKARGRWLAFTDDDVIVDANWLLEIHRCFLQTGCDGIGGRVLPIYPPETPNWIRRYPKQMSGVVVILDFGESMQPFTPAMERFIGCNFAFRKEVFTEFGLFREDLGPGMKTVGEDAEFSYRLIKKNKVLYYCGTAVVYHPVNLKRLHLKFMMHWNMAQGRYVGRLEYEAKGNEMIFYGGVPRYLWKMLMNNILMLLLTVFHRRMFFKTLRRFFRYVGMIQEYRRLSNKRG